MSPDTAECACSSPLSARGRCSLAERLTDTALQVLMNGRPLGVQFKRNSAYVAQEDCFVPTMSAVETLNFTATLTLPKSVTVEERNDRIEEVLRIMGLYRSRDTQVTPSSALQPSACACSNMQPNSRCGRVRSPGKAVIPCCICIPAYRTRPVTCVHD